MMSETICQDEDDDVRDDVREEVDDIKEDVDDVREEVDDVRPPSTVLLCPNRSSSGDKEGGVGGCGAPRAMFGWKTKSGYILKEERTEGRKGGRTERRTIGRKQDGRKEGR